MFDLSSDFSIALIFAFPGVTLDKARGEAIGVLAISGGISSA